MEAVIYLVIVLGVSALIIGFQSAWGFYINWAVEQ